MAGAAVLAVGAARALLLAGGPLGMLLGDQALDPLGQLLVPVRTQEGFGLGEIQAAFVLEGLVGGLLTKPSPLTGAALTRGRPAHLGRSLTSCTFPADPLALTLPGGGLCGNLPLSVSVTKVAVAGSGLPFHRISS